MSLIFRKRWEIIFLVEHSRESQMSVEHAAKYLNESKGWAYNVLRIYQEKGNVDLSYERGRKRASTEK